MRRKSFFVVVFAIFLNGSFSNIFGQTTLSAGDVAITSFNSDGDDEFSFVLLKDVTSGTVIYFTENGWDDDANGGGIAPTWGNTGEGTLIWTSTSAMSCGTEIQVIKPHVNATLEVSAGSISKSGTWAVKSSGEAIIIYQGTAKPTDGTEVTAFLWAFNTGSSNFVSNSTATATTGIPTGLVSGTDAIYAGSSDNFQYDCVTLGALVSLKSALASSTNFTASTTINYKASGCSFYCTSVNNWTGATNTDWNTTGNWSGGIPTSSSTVSIPNVTNKPVISSVSTGVANNLTIDASSSLTINAGKDLTISSNLTNNGTFTIASDATTSGSLIVTGTSTGNITYNRYLTSTVSAKWHLIAAPVGAQSINTFVTTVANNVAKSGVNYSVTPYNNTFTKGTAGTWTHWTTNATNPVSGAGNFISGKGYEILTTADGTVAFTGTVPVAQVSIGVTVGGTNAWNLIGNPFPSSIPANINADATNNFITVNSAAMDASYQGVYLWNPSTSSYNLINQATVAATYIAPGQGFFVKSVAGGSTVNFTTAMRSNQTTVAFQKAGTTATPSITLIADNNAGKTSATAIKYMGGMSLGLDPGYDGGRFGATGTGFGIYSKLVNDNGVDFALQVVPDTGYDTTVIPIGLDADAGTQITFKAAYSNLPVGKKVFLEDRLLGSFTEINNTDKAYTLTLNTQSSGVGRFFLHTQDNASTLVVANINALKFSIIALPKSNLIRLIGSIDEPATLNIYDTLGRFVFTTKLKGTNNNEVDIPQIAMGIYFVKIKTAKSNFSTKIAWY